jgi:hypothetical protein
VIRFKMMMCVARVVRKSMCRKMCEDGVFNRKMIPAKILVYYKSFRKTSCPMMTQVEVCHRKMVCAEMKFM